MVRHAVTVKGMRNTLGGGCLFSTGTLRSGSSWVPALMARVNVALWFQSHWIWKEGIQHEAGAHPVHG